MTDREQFDRWLEREARRMHDAAAARAYAAWQEHKERRRREYVVAQLEDYLVPPVSEEIEAFIRSTERR